MNWIDLQIYNIWTCFVNSVELNYHNIKYEIELKRIEI